MFIDENFTKSAIRKEGKGITLDQLDQLPTGKFEVTGELEPHRQRLARALRSCENGGIPRTALIAAGLTVDNCAEARKLEWTCWTTSRCGRHQAGASKAGNVKHVRAMYGIWRAAEELLACDGDAVSGRLYLADARPPRARSAWFERAASGRSPNSSGCRRSPDGRNPAGRDGSAEVVRR